MVLNLDVSWAGPIELRGGAPENLVYTLWDFLEIPEGPGAYVFARVHGATISPLYVGKASSLRTRVEQQFNNNVRLMTALRNAPAGTRVLLIAELHIRPGQQVSRALNVLESALIEHFLASGWELLNIQGTRTPAHEINFTERNSIIRQLVPNSMFIRSV